MRDGGRLPLTPPASPTRCGVLERKLATWPQATRAARAGHRASGATRSRRSAAICASGCRKLPEADGWTPAYFEFSFGLSDEGRDQRSVAEPVTIDGRFRLRGSVDLVESQRRIGGAARHRSQDRQEPNDAADGDRRRRHAAAGALRHGGREDARQPGRGGRLFYCTAAGGFTEHAVPLNEANRRAGLEALEIIDRAIELGFLPPAPGRARLHLVRLPGGLRPGRGAARARKPADSSAT